MRFGLSMVEGGKRLNYRTNGETNNTVVLLDSLVPTFPVPNQVLDPREGKGPVQGIAAGLAALAGQADAAFITSTDLPFLHPAYIGRVLRALGPQDGGPDVALPVARGYQQPLAAAYRTSLAELAERLVKEDRLRPAFLFQECAVERLDDAPARLANDEHSELAWVTPEEMQALHPVFPEDVAILARAARGPTDGV